MQGIQIPNGKSGGIEGVIHSSSRYGVIVINYPGANGTIDGYNDKYVKLAHIVSQQIGTVIRVPNFAGSLGNWENDVKDNLRAVIDYALENAKDLSGRNNPEILLMGVSAGASAIAAVAYQYPNVKRILLIAPSGDAGQDSIERGLSKYLGEVYIAIGDNDRVAGTNAGQTFCDLATKASVCKLVIIQNCDHQFTGEKNGMILSKAPLWAFIDENTFPSPTGGTKLY